MSPAPDPVPLDTLLSHRDWVRTVARRLVADPAAVDDVEQETWIAAIRSPPRDADTVRGWLARVVRNQVLDRARAGRRRRAHEDAAARGAVPVGAVDVVAQADLHKRVVLAVMELDEPYRSTLLLRFFEDLSPRAVAARLGVPVETVRTRTRRGLQRLRERFDAEHDGDRRAWCLLLLPLLGEAEAPPWLSAGTQAGAASRTAAVSAATGAVIVAGTTKKVLVAAGVVLALAVGGWLTNQALAPAPGATRSDPARPELAGRGTDRDGVQPAAVAAGPEAAAGRDAVAASGAVRVLVRDQLGRAVADAVVAITAEAPDAERFWDPLAHRAALLSAGPPLAASRTDAAGRTLIVGLPAGDYAVTAERAGRSAARARTTVAPESAPAEISLVLGEGHALRGVVRDHDGTLLPRALVAAEPGLGARSTADERGRFMLDGLAAGVAILHVARPGGDPYEVARVRIPEVTEIELRLGGGVLTGRVLDDVTGAPIPGALVRALAGDHFASAVRARADEKGRYALRTSVDGPVFQLVVVDAGLRDQAPLGPDPDVGEMHLSGGRVVQRDLRLRPGGAVEGTVRSAAGPVGGAYVTAHWRREREVAKRPGTTWTSCHDAPGVVSAADGTYRIEGVSPGRILVQARHPGRAQVGFPASWQTASDAQTESVAIDVASGETATLDLEVTAGARVAGRVEDAAGQPVGGAIVSGWGVQTPVVTGDDGAFTLTAVRPGAQSGVWAWLPASGHPAAFAPLALEDGEARSDVVLRLAEDVIVFGRVTASDGARLEGAYVQVSEAFPDDMPADYVDQLFADAPRFPVDADGHYTVPLPFSSRDFVVRAAAAGYPPVRSGVIGVQDGASRYRADVMLVPGATLAGIVRDASGAPAADVLLHVGPAGQERLGDPPVAAVSAADGAFTVRSLAPGRQDVIARAPDGRAARAVVAVPGRVELELPASRAISGRVVFADGGPAVGVRVSVRPRDAGAGPGPGLVPAAPASQGGTATGADGSFSVGPLDAGRYDLVVVSGQDSGDAIRMRQVPDVAVGTSGLRIVVERGAAVSGVVVDERGVPAVGVSVFVTDAETHQGWGDTTGRDGDFRAVGLGDAPVSILARATGPDGTPLQALVEGVAPGSTGLRIVIQPMPVVSGHIAWPDGSAAAGYVVALELCEPLGSGGFVNVPIDADGAFRLPVEADATYRLLYLEELVDQMSWEMLDRAGTPLRGGDRVRTGTTGLRLEPGAPPALVTLSGRVLRGDGEPAAGAVVEVVQTAGAGRFTRCADDGSFAVESLVGGTPCRVRAWAPGWVRTTVHDVDAGAADVVVTLESGLRATGRLVAADGTPVADAELHLRHAEDGAPAAGRTDADGRFEIRGMQAGTYAVRVRLGDGRPRACGEVAAAARDVTLTVEE